MWSALAECVKAQFKEQNTEKLTLSLTYTHTPANDQCTAQESDCVTWRGKLQRWSSRERRVPKSWLDANASNLCLAKVSGWNTHTQNTPQTLPETGQFGGQICLGLSDRSIKQVRKMKWRARKGTVQRWKKTAKGNQLQCRRSAGWGNTTSLLALFTAFCRGSWPRPPNNSICRHLFVVVYIAVMNESPTTAVDHCSLFRSIEQREHPCISITISIRNTRIHCRVSSMNALEAVVVRKICKRQSSSDQCQQCCSRRCETFCCTKEHFDRSSVNSGGGLVLCCFLHLYLFDIYDGAIVWKWTTRNRWKSLWELVA